MCRFKLLICVITAILMSEGCAQPISHSLKVEIKDNNLCLYTDSEKTYLDENNYFIIFVNEYNPGQQSKSIYEQSFHEKKFPIKKEDCITVPSEIFEQDKIYDVNLESNKNFSELVCISGDKNKLKVQVVSPEDKSCK